MFQNILRNPFYWFQHNLYNDVYATELANWQVQGKTRATNADFAADLTYYVAERVGSNGDVEDANEGTDGLFVMREHTVNPDHLADEARRFVEHVRNGNVYLTATAATTTTTTTAAPTTTTTTAG